jgi:two-component system phosphate regulon sensor histidine kinase PhoR
MPMELRTPTMERIGSDPHMVLREIIDTTRECVLVLADDNRIAASNAAAAEAFARQTGPLENRRLSEIIRDPKLHEAFGNALIYRKTSDIKFETSVPNARKYDVHIAPIRLDGRDCAIGFFYDITQIERLETVRQEFLSNISHELRTPLTSILAFVETLEDGAIDDKENNRRFLGVIRRNGERMHSLISDILELSLIESGKVSVELREVNLTNLVEQVFTDLSANARARGIELINKVEADRIVNADAFRLEQMLTNLVDNAIKFNQPSGSVTVSCTRRDRMHIISVSDTGEGIMAEHVPRIFERFYRIDRARSREVGGTGLGLAIVKHLAKLHGGEVSVVSVLGRGTTFLIELPVK